MISVNTEISKRIGVVVGKQTFNPSFYERAFIQIDSPLKMAMHFYAVGICHQTYVLANPKLNLYGWDFLEYGFLDILKNASHLLDAQSIVQLSIPKLIEEIKPYFAEDHQAEKCTLDRLEERARLWMDMAEGLLKYFDGKIENLFVKSDWNKTQEAESFYRELRLFEAYSDPLQKKSGVFLKLIDDANLVDISRLKNAIPIMDYHMQRVLLRSGCIEVEDEILKSKLQNREALSDDSEIREACIQAMNIIAKTSSYPVYKMNDVFYTLGRSCCNETSLCRDHVCEKSPCTLTRSLILESHESCIFQNVCKAATDNDYIKYWQPIVETHYY
jgi:hypothetical protein